MQTESIVGDRIKLRWQPYDNFIYWQFFQDKMTHSASRIVRLCRVRAIYLFPMEMYVHSRCLSAFKINKNSVTFETSH